MIKVEIPPGDLARINDLKVHHPIANIRSRMLVLWLKHLGTKHKDICRIGNISKTTLTVYLKLFLEGGVDAVIEWNYKGRPSKLDGFNKQIIADFDMTPPATLAESADRIERITGLRRSQTQVREYLHRIHFRRIKTGSAPGKIDPVGQEEFKKKSSTLCWTRLGLG